MTLFRCAACGHTLFPARLLCPRCGNAAWEPVECGGGRVEAITTLSGEGRIASVRAGSAVVLARLDGEGQPGDAVRLDERTDGAVIARRMEEA